MTQPNPAIPDERSNMGDAACSRRSGVLRTEPVPVSALREPAAIASEVGTRSATVRPMFTCRTLRPPQPWGHRRMIDQRMIAGRTRGMNNVR